MMKKLCTLLIALALMVSMLGTFVGCGGDDEHTHTFDKEVATDTYLKTPASATSGAEYYYSCECGFSGEKTFISGDPIHVHAFDKQVTTEKYLKDEATATSAATYYYSCECGEKGTTVFTFGDPAHEHIYDKQVAADAYIQTGATTESPAIYYYSCECGKVGTETFLHGERLKTDLEKALEAVENTEINSVTTVVTTVRNGVTLTAKSVYQSGSATVEYEVLSKLDMENPDTPMTKKETLPLQNGENALVVENMNFTGSAIANLAVENGNLTGKIVDPSAFFGCTVAGFTEASFTVTIAENVMTGITVTYTTVGGSTVTMTATLG